jgi:NTE family protein
MWYKNGDRLSLRDKRVVLLLQGGGALGAYQVGTYDALDEACRAAGNRIDWVGGISIGAINAAVIAGPKCGDSSRELANLWEEILSPAELPFDFSGLWGGVQPAFRFSWLAALAPKYWNWIWQAWGPIGQPDFFTARFFYPWLLQWFCPLTQDQLANYGTGSLGETLNRHVDWGAINRLGGTKLSLGATGVTNGEVRFFNSFDSPKWGAKRTIRARHVMASAALPPAFPPITIDGEPYWDGGLSSNTPVEELAEDLTREEGDTIVFLIDLWDRKEALPRSMDEVMWRQKSIQFGSRKRAAVSVVNKHELEVQAGRVPPTLLEVCQVMFERPRDDRNPRFSFSDADFCRATFQETYDLGYEDMAYVLEHREPVCGVGGQYAVLYRHGTYGKHWETDRKHADAWRREQERRNAREAILAAAPEELERTWTNSSCLG